MLTNLAHISLGQEFPICRVFFSVLVGISRAKG